MRKISIGLSAPNKFKLGAFAIQKYINRDYSHVLIYWHSDSINKTLVYQASLGMVHFCSMERFESHNSVVKHYDLEVTDNQFNKLVSKCVELAGVEYSVLELLGIFTNNVLNRDLIGDQPGFICSELVAELLQDVTGGKFSKPLHLVNPSDVDSFLGGMNV
jgi:hypothetical protein